MRELFHFLHSHFIFAEYTETTYRLHDRLITTMMKNGAEIGIVTIAIKTKNYYMATNLMDTGRFLSSYIKQYVEPF